jgi:hypothetical protein
MEVRPYVADDAETWDRFTDEAHQSTFLHSRRFLSYHGDRFRDLSLVIENDGKWIGLFPAAQHSTDDTCVVSHPGITYGGVLHQGTLKGERMIAVLDLVCRHYATERYAKLLYKAVPTIYHRTPAQDDSYAMFRLGALRTRCDLSSSIDMRRRLPISERRRRSLKKAVKAGVAILEGHQLLPQFWAILVENLSRKHDSLPVHSLGEITLLATRFPSNIRCICGTLNNVVIAGVLLFATDTCIHAQYIASNETGNAVSALDVVFDYSIEQARLHNKTWFDFGISNENAGLCLNDGLYRFKSEFGGGGVVYECFELSLRGK